MSRLFSGKLRECLRLSPRILDWSDRPEGSFGNDRTADHFRHGQDMPLDLPDEAQQSHNLSDTRSGEAKSRLITRVPGAMLLTATPSGLRRLRDQFGATP